MTGSTTGDATAHWAERLRTHATDIGVAGAALAIWSDGQEVVATHGVHNARTGAPVRPDSLFQIGSITKTWTATMIQQLAEEGRLQLDTTVAELLPGARVGTPDAAGEVTVRHLLTHTSGIDGDLFTDTGRGDDCVERYVELLADAPRNYPVGAAYSYCNSGWVLLGRIIEVLDGRGWDASLRARLVEPLGLHDTVTLPEEALLHSAAVGHKEPPLETEPVPVWQLPRSLGPAGLISASVSDVLGYARMHLDGGRAADGTQVLGADAVAAMQQPQREIPSVDGRGDAIGLGWRLNTWGGRRVFGHDGGTIGQLAYLRVDPQARLAVGLLTNSTLSDALYLRLLTDVFTEHVGVAPPAPPSPGAARAEAELARHVGTYERSSWRFDVSLLDGELHGVSTVTRDAAEVADEGPKGYVLHPVDAHPDAFVLRDDDREPWAPLRFDHFPDGRPYVFVNGRATPKRT